MVHTDYAGFALDKGTFSISITAREGKNLKKLEKELDAFLSSRSFSQKDVDNAKKRLVADLEYLNDDPEKAAHLVGLFYSLGLTVDDLKSWKENIENVSLADVQKAYADMTAAPYVTTCLMPEDAP